MGNHDGTVNHEWATRPSDERFLTMADLMARVEDRRATSREVGMALDHLRALPNGDDMLLGSEAGIHGSLTHYAFGQLCVRAKAPAGYLRGLPSALAAIPLQWSMEHADDADGRLLVRENGRDMVAAITSDSYGRIWDSQVCKAIKENCNLERWKVPGASYASSDPLRATTLYASDRDVFIFLVDESRPIEVDGRTFYRGFYCWNSEVGSATFGIATFLYETVCDNRNIWGQRDFKELRIRHTSGGPHRFMYEARPALAAYSEASAQPVIETIRAASAKQIGTDKASVTDWLRARGFSQAIATRAYEAAEQDGRNPRTVFGVVSGLTEIAHETKWTDERVALERKAGALLDIAA